MFDAYFDERLRTGMTLVAEDRSTGEIVGWSSYGNLADDGSEIEIGWTFLVRSRWGGATYAELKALMIGHAFSSFERVVFRLGVDNIRVASRHRKAGRTAA